MQDVRTASSSCNTIFAFTALRPRLALAPEGRWYTNEPVALMDLWHRHPVRLRYHASISPSFD
jgi:hypothetical protein